MNTLVSYHVIIQINIKFFQIKKFINKFMKSDPHLQNSMKVKWKQYCTVDIEQV